MVFNIFFTFDDTYCYLYWSNKMTKSFDELLKHHGLSLLRWDSDNYANANTQLASEFYKAGAQSKQAEIDDLRKRIEKTDSLIMSFGDSIDVPLRNSLIDAIRGLEDLQMTHQKEQPMNSERKAFEEYYIANHHDGDIHPNQQLLEWSEKGEFYFATSVNDLWDMWYASVNRQGYKLVPENEINIMDMIHGKCPCGSSRSPIISDKEGYSLIHCFSCGANKYIHEDY